MLAGGSIRLRRNSILARRFLAARASLWPTAQAARAVAAPCQPLSTAWVLLLSLSLTDCTGAGWKLPSVAMILSRAACIPWRVMVGRLGRAPAGRPALGIIVMTLVHDVQRLQRIVIISQNIEDTLHTDAAP